MGGESGFQPVPGNPARSLQGLREQWNRWSERKRLPFAIDSLLKGCGQVFFSASPLSGLVMMAAIFAMSWPVGFSALVGLICATATAWLLGQSPHRLHLGLYGFNGLLVGWLWGYFWPAYPQVFFLNPILSAASTLLMMAFSRWGGKYGLPALSLPFAVVIWGSLLILYGLKALPFSPAIPPFFTGPASWAGEWKIPLDYLKMVLSGMVLIWVGVLIFSRVAAGMFLLGLGAGLGIAFLLGGPNGAYWVGLYAFTTTPLAMAWGGIFFRCSGGAVLCALFAILAGSALWWALSVSLAPLGLYPLTAPFVITLWFFLLSPVSSFFSRVWGITPVPLAWVSRPEATQALPRPKEGSDSENQRPMKAAAEILRSSKTIVALVGAGISTESGIPDYRSPGGYWTSYDPADFAFPRFQSDPGSRQRYWQVSSKFYDMLRFAQPNAGHLALAELERRGLLLGIITQNVDGLHHKAGNSPERILEIHGTEHVISCLDCHAKFARWEPGPWTLPGTEEPRCPHCHGLLKPDSVLFGQPIPPEKLEKALSWLTRTDLLLVIGSSLLVQPVASFPARAKEMGAKVMIINLSPTGEDPLADLCLRGKASSILTRMMQDLRGREAGLAVRSLTRPDYLEICKVADFWYGVPISYLLHPIYVEQFSTTSFVAEKDGRIVGFILGFISQDQPEIAYAHLLVIDPHLRGQGIGRALYGRFFEAAIERGCLTVMAITVPYNQGSIAFHHRLGFSLQEKGAVWENGYPLMKDYAGPGIHCLVFARSLAQPFP